MLPWGLHQENILVYCGQHSGFELGGKIGRTCHYEMTSKNDYFRGSNHFLAPFTLLILGIYVTAPVTCRLI